MNSYLLYMTFRFWFAQGSHRSIRTARGLSGRGASRSTITFRGGGGSFLPAIVIIFVPRKRKRNEQNRNHIIKRYSYKEYELTNRLRRFWWYFANHQRLRSLRPRWLLPYNNGRRRWTRFIWQLIDNDLAWWLWSRRLQIPIIVLFIFFNYISQHKNFFFFVFVFYTVFNTRHDFNQLISISKLNCSIIDI